MRLGRGVENLAQGARVRRCPLAVPTRTDRPRRGLGAGLGVEHARDALRQSLRLACRRAIAHAEHERVEPALHARCKRLAKGAGRLRRHTACGVDPEQLVLEAPHDVVFEDVGGRRAGGAGRRLAAPDECAHQGFFLAQAAAILLLAQRIDTDVLQHIGQRADEAIALGDGKIGVAHVIGLVEQQAEAESHRFGIIDRQRGQPDSATVGARPRTADAHLHAAFSGQYRAQNMQRALQRTRLHDPLRAS